MIVVSMIYELGWFVGRERGVFLGGGLFLQGVFIRQGPGFVDA